jgi:hypothetical protein
MFHIPSIAKIPSAMILGYWPEGDCLPLVSLFGFSGAFTWTSTPQLSRRSDKTTKPATAAAAESPAAASPTPAKQRGSKKKEAITATTASPVAASPSPAKRSWFQPKTASPTPATSPVIATSPTINTSTTAKTTKATEPAATPAAGGGPGMVWVNTETHVYHKEGSRWYGKTKNGKYVSEQDAIKEGDHADKAESKAKKP